MLAWKNFVSFEEKKTLCCNGSKNGANLNSIDRQGPLFLERLMFVDISYGKIKSMLRKLRISGNDPFIFYLFPGCMVDHHRFPYILETENFVFV